MRILKQQITDLTSINLDTSLFYWSATQTYPFGHEVRLGHYKYKSAIDNNHGNQPSDRSLSWVSMGVLNTYAMLDTRSTTKTRWDASLNDGTPTDALQFTFPADNFTEIAFVHAHMESVRVEYLDNVGTPTAVLERRSEIWCGGTSWWEYYFSPFCETITKGPSDAFYFPLSPTPGGAIRVTAVPKDGYVEIGAVVAGVSDYAGCAQWGATRAISGAGIARDDFNVFTGTRRQPTGAQAINVVYDVLNHNDIYQLAQDTNNTVALVIVDEVADTPYDGLVMLANIGNFSQTAKNSSRAAASWNVEESI